MRVSRSLLESRLATVNNLLGFKDGDSFMVCLKYHQPGGTKYTWSLYFGVKRVIGKGRYYYIEFPYAGPSGRMTPAECLERLESIIRGLEFAKGRGPNANPMDEPGIT